jgi:hypothetical protein
MHSRIQLRVLTVAVVCAVVVCAFRAYQQTVHAQSALQVIASGLDNPRGLNFGPDGALYVVEAGRGGTSALCLPIPEGPPGATRCYGPTGAVTRITNIGVHQRVVTGLPSLAPPTGEQATGPHDIDFGFGQGWITIGLGGDPAIRAPFAAAGVQLGHLVRVMPTGAWDYIVDISAHEAAANPDGGPVDSNPYGLGILSNRGVVADAGANALLQISATGALSTLAVFPSRTVSTPAGPRTIQSVPTTVVEGPDGSLFVGELTGAPFPVGAAQVYYVPANGGTPVVVAGGFTNIIDIAFDAVRGVGYVLEHDADGIIPTFGPSSNGRLIRINGDGTQTVISAALVKPGGVAVGPDGALYVTNRSIFAGTGEVVRIVP